jgi:zeaxanthin glucosyltransferase
VDKTCNDHLDYCNGNQTLVLLTAGMKPKIVFLVYHGFGHFNACFKLAKTLSKTHHPVFAGHIYFQKYITAQGFDFYPLKSVPFGMGFEKWVNTELKKKNIYWASLKDRWNNKLYHKRERELRSLITEIKADTFLIDSWQCTDFIVLYPLLKNTRTKVAFIQTMLSTVVEHDVPLLNCDLFPGNKKEIQKAHASFKRRSFMKEFLDSIKFLGRSNESLIRRMIKKNNIPKDIISNKQTIYNLPVFNIPEFILAPAEFDFSSSSKSLPQRYIGFNPDLNRLESTDQNFADITKRINHVKTRYQYFIYCSFGSVAHQELKPVETFLHALIPTIKNLNAVCLISINNKEIIDAFSNVGENIFILQSVPQLLVLSWTDVFITHGGLNSIKESVYAEVPMLVYPVIPQTDLNGNAARVVYHKLGLNGNLEQDTAEDIQNKIEELLSNSEYKTNIRKLKEIDQVYDIVQILSF